jgi:hypothetical protein
MMKKLLFACVLSLSLWACKKGQEVDQSKVPDPVVQSFFERYPVATDVQWRQDGTTYIVDFSYDNDHKEATYRNDGTFLDAK